jgi:AcrR family transcriptional regulator
MGLRRDQTRARILDAAYGEFWRAGFSRTNVDGIALRAKLTKRTLYAHFRSKDDLLAAVLQHQSELTRTRMAEIDANLPNDRNGLVDSLFDQLAAWHTRQRRFAGSGFTKLAAELSDMPGHPARAIAARHKQWVERWYAQRLRKVGVSQADAKARQIMLLIEGSMSLVVIHGDRDYFAAAAKAAKRLLSKR